MYVYAKNPSTSIFIMIATLTCKRRNSFLYVDLILYLNITHLIVFLLGQVPDRKCTSCVTRTRSPSDIYFYQLNMNVFVCMYACIHTRHDHTWVHCEYIFRNMNVYKYEYGGAWPCIIRWACERVWVSVCVLMRTYGWMCEECVCVCVSVSLCLDITQLCSSFPILWRNMMSSCGEILPCLEKRWVLATGNHLAVRKSAPANFIWPMLAWKSGR